MKKNTNEGQVIAKARDKFFHENASLLEGKTSGQYLKNRLEKAFIAGWEASRRTRKKRKK